MNSIPSHPKWKPLHGLVLTTSIGLSVAMLGGCVSTGSVPNGQAMAGYRDVQDLYVVDCLLPGQVRRLGGTTYLTPRRPVRTTTHDCRIRGGEYVAYDRADYRAALNVWLDRAQAGDAEAQNYVGEIFEKGLGQDPDYPSAAAWYRRAAEQGFARAQINLGYLYENGLGVQRDSAMALNWYRRASGLDQDELVFRSEFTEEIAVMRSELSRQIDENNRQITALRNQLNRMRNERDVLQRQLEATQGSEAAATGLAILSTITISAQREVSEAERRTAETRRAAAEADREAAEAQQSIRTLEREVDQIRARISAAEGEAEQARVLAVQAEQQLMEARRSAAGAEREAFNTRVAAAERQAEIAHQRAVDAEREAETARSAAMQAEREAAQASDRIIEAERAAEQARRRAAEAEQESAQARQTLERERRIAQTEQAARDQTSRVQVADLEESLARARAEIQVLEGLFQRTDEERGRLQVQLAQLPQQRSVPIPELQPLTLPAQDPATVAGINFGRYYALIIGNRDYQHLDSLVSPINDAERVRRLLEDRYGFRTIFLPNADKRQVLNALNDLYQQLRPEDNLLVYYAGHGNLSERDQGRRQNGYWLPVDAERERLALWINNAVISDHLDRIRARSILVLADSCYAGTLASDSSALLLGSVQASLTPDMIKGGLSRRSRVVISSGGVRPVLDTLDGEHSVFASALIHALENNDEVLRENMLFARVAVNVRRRSQNVTEPQTPEMRPIRAAGHEGGEFYFVPVASR